MQRNWIGRSRGRPRSSSASADLDERAAGLHDAARHAVRRDFFVLAPEHPLVARLVAGTEREAEVLDYVRHAARESAVERGDEDRHEDGRRHRPHGRQPGQRRAHPDLGRRLRADGVRHRRDHGGARARRARPRLRARSSACRSARSSRRPTASADVRGRATSRTAPTRCWSTPASSAGQRADEALPAMVAWLEETGRGEATIAYRLRDWLVSRQRYWGAPIPVVDCPTLRPGAGARTTQLPVLLPEVEDYAPQGPLAAGRGRGVASHDVPAVRRRGAARDRHDGHVRRLVVVLHPLRRRPERRARRGIATTVDWWLPVDQYIGGVEHAILHLLYARFFAKVLYDAGLRGLPGAVRATCSRRA